MSADNCPYGDFSLRKLPKGSSCTEWKKAPARSSYWKDDTREVDRCAEWATGNDSAPPSQDDGGDGESGGESEGSDESEPGPDDMPDDVNGWKLRRNKNGQIVYVGETNRFAYGEMDRTADAVAYLGLYYNNGDWQIKAITENIDNGREKHVKTSGLGVNQPENAEQGLKRLRVALRKKDPARRFAPPTEVNGFHNVITSETEISYVRGELPDDLEYESVGVQARWRYSHDDAPEYPKWDVRMLYWADGETIRTRQLREGMVHYADAFDLMRQKMKDFDVEAEWPENVGPWEQRSTGLRRVEYRADTGKDVPYAGNRKRLYKYVEARSTASGWEVEMQKGYRDDDPRDRETVADIDTKSTEVGAKQAAVTFMEDNDDVDETEDDVDLPQSVNGWTTANEDELDEHATGLDEPLYGWQADDPVYIYVKERGRRNDDEPYGVALSGENVASLSFGRHETQADAIDECIAKMEALEPKQDQCRFTADLSNGVTKVIANMVNRVGHTSDARTLLETSDDPKEAITISSTGWPTWDYGMRVTIPSGALDSFDVDRHGAVSFDPEIFIESYRKGKKSDDSKLAVQPTDSEDLGPKVHANVPGKQRSARARNPISYVGNWPESDGADASLETTARELINATEAMDVIADVDSSSDQTQVVCDVRDGELVFVIENEADERGKATIGEIEDDAKVAGNATVSLRYGRLKGLAKALPKPASTTLSVQFHDESHIDVRFVDESTQYEAFIAQTDDEIPEYDLSEAPELTGWERYEHDGCPFDGLTLGEPLEAGQQAPDIDGIDLSDGDTILWTFPNTDGCRCGAQARQYEDLHQELGVDVYGIAASPQDELREMVNRYDLSINLVSDPDGELASELGVEFEGENALERRTFFVRDGEITDVSEGVTQLELAEPTESDDERCPFEGLGRPPSGQSEFDLAASDDDTRVFDGPTADLVGPQNYVFGDVDGDDIPNVDDRNPFKAGADDRFYEELSLSKDVLRRAQTVTERHRDVFNEVVDEWDIEKGRVKQPISILEKLLRKYLDELTDIIGVTIYEDNHADILAKADEITSKYEVIKDKNYISDPKNDVYYAYHVIIVWPGEKVDGDEIEVEIQIKTPEEAKLQGEMHEAYKQNEDMDPYEERAKELARKNAAPTTGVDNNPERDNAPTPEPEDALNQPDGGFTLSAKQTDELYEQVDHPGVYVVTGTRGAGKSALAHQFAEKQRERENVVCCTVGTPEAVREHYPDHWEHVEQIDNAPPHSVVVIDEAYLQFSARRSMQDSNLKMGAYINTSRHCDRTLVFVSQNSGHLDKMAVSEADGMLIKEPGTFHMEFERKQVRDMSERAKQSFDQLPQSHDSVEYVYAVTDGFEGLVQNDKPDWYDDEVSRSYSAACETPDDSEAENAQAD